MRTYAASLINTESCVMRGKFVETDVSIVSIVIFWWVRIGTNNCRSGDTPH